MQKIEIQHKCVLNSKKLVNLNLNLDFPSSPLPCSESTLMGVSTNDLIKCYLKSFCLDCALTKSNFSINDKLFSVKVFIDHFLPDLKFNSFQKSCIIYLSHGFDVLLSSTYKDIIKGSCPLSFIFSDGQVNLELGVLQNIFEKSFVFEEMTVSSFIKKYIVEITKCDNSVSLYDIFINKNKKFVENSTLEYAIQYWLNKSSHSSDNKEIYYRNDSFEWSFEQNELELFSKKERKNDYYGPYSSDEEEKGFDVLDLTKSIHFIDMFTDVADVLSLKPDGCRHFNYGELLKFGELNQKSLKFVTLFAEQIFKKLKEKYNLKIEYFQMDEEENLTTFKAEDSEETYICSGANINEARAALIFGLSKFGRVVCKPEFPEGKYVEVNGSGYYSTISVKGKEIISLEYQEAIRKAKQIQYEKKGLIYNLDCGSFKLTNYFNLAEKSVRDKANHTKQNYVYDHGERVGVFQYWGFRKPNKLHFNDDVPVLHFAQSNVGINDKGLTTKPGGLTVRKYEEEIYKILFLINDHDILETRRFNWIFFDGEFDKNDDGIYVHASYQLKDTLVVHTLYDHKRFFDNLDEETIVLCSDPEKDLEVFSYLKRFRVVDVQPMYKWRYGAKGIKQLMEEFKNVCNYDFDVFDRSQKSIYGKTVYQSMLEQVCFFLLFKNVIDVH